MGLLTQALAGGISQGADTYADLLVDQIKTDKRMGAQTEMEKAREIRERSLAEYRQKLATDAADSGMVDSYGAKMSNAELAEYRQSMTEGDEDPRSADEWKRRTEIDKNMLVDDEEATVGQVQDIKEANKARGFIDEARKAEAERFMNSPEAKDMTPEERGKRMSEIMGQDEEARSTWEEDSGKLTRIKDIEAQQKIEKERLDREQKSEIEKAKLEEKEASGKRHKETLLAIAANKTGDKDASKGPVLRSIEAADGIRTFDMGDPKQREQFKGWISSGKGVEYFGGDVTDTNEETGEKIKRKVAASGVIGSVAPKSTAPQMDREQLSTELASVIEKINKSSLTREEKQKRINTAVQRANSIK